MGRYKAKLKLTVLLFQIHVKEIFHLPPKDKLQAGDRVALYTPAGEDFCGTSFVRRGTYLLSGRILNSILIVVSCLLTFVDLAR